MKTSNVFLIVKKHLPSTPLLTAFLLSLITFIFYYSSLTYGFIFDDLPTITNYYYIRFFDPIGQFFSNSRWVSRLLNQFTYHYWQTNPFAYRIVNLFLHIAIGIMIFYVLLSVLKGLKKNEWLKENAYIISTLTAVLFLLHPVQTQTATYITQMRLEGLVVFFTFLVLTTFVYAVKASNQYLKIILYASSFLLAAFSVGTKEIIIVLPALILAFDWFFLAEGELSLFKKRLLIHAGYFLIIFGLLYKFQIASPHYISTIVTTPLANNRGNILTTSVHDKITLFPYFISQFKVLLHYVRIFFWPFGISFDYDVKLSRSLFSLDVVIPFLMLLYIAFITLRLMIRERNHVFSFCSFWFFISMLPRASFFPSTELICDYKTYLASFAPMFLLAIVLTYGIRVIVKMVSHQHMNLYKYGAVVLIVLVFGFSTKIRNNVWSSELLFWQDIIKKAPKARVYNNLGTSYLHVKNKDKAIESFNKAIEVDDFYAEPHINLGVIYHSLGKKDRSFQHYKRAVEIGEMHPELYNNFGLLHLDNKNYEAAEICFRTAVQLRPHYGKALFLLARTCGLQGKHEEALEAYRKALDMQIDSPEAYYLYAEMCRKSENIDDAIKYFEKIDKRYKGTAFLLGCCYYTKRMYSKAAQCFEISHKDNPTNSIYAYNYAQALLNINDFEKALSLFEQCQKVEGAYPYAGLHIAKCLHCLGKIEDAKTGLLNLINTTKHNNIKRDGVQLMQEISSS